MGRMREEKSNKSSSPPFPLSEALLMTTMCIIGFPVEVHIKDGSIFSGIFHTASTHNGYGVALKKAQMIKKGTRNANVANGGLIDTLVVLPEDLVQVVAKGVVLPVDSSATSDKGGVVSGSTGTFQGPEKGPVRAAKHANHQRQVRVGSYQGKEDGNHHASEAVRKVHEVHHSATSLNGSNVKLNPLKETPESKATNGSLLTSAATTTVNILKQLTVKENLQTEYVAPDDSDLNKRESGATCRSSPATAETLGQNLATDKTFKVSKLNPGAKLFSPSLPSFRSIPTAPTATYVPNSIPAARVVSPQPEVGIRPVAPRSSWPAKFVPYATSAAVTTDHSFQYSQGIAGHMETRTQPVRHVAQYQPIQNVRPYLHANPQNGMFGRSGQPGQLVYVHPITHDMIPTPVTFSQAPHPLLTSHPIHVSKHEATLGGQAMQVSVAPPLMTNGPPPVMMPSHIQLSQPLFTHMRPVQFQF